MPRKVKQKGHFLAEVRRFKDGLLKAWNCELIGFG